MQYFMRKEENYERIINILCKYKGIDREELYSILKDSECRYVLFLLLKKYDCVDVEMLNKDFSMNSMRRINYNVKKAEEKLLLNKRIRDIYFEAENILDNVK